MAQTDSRLARIQQLFSDALKLQTRNRAKFLSEACAGDNELRREVESLLESDEPQSSFLQTPAYEISASKIAAQVLESEEASAVGKLVGAYRIAHEIGRGGMGAIYLAERTDGQFEKQVAIKLLRRGLENEDVIRRFQNERQILADLEHANIARLIDGGTTENGLPYFVMEYVQGLPLNRFCDERNLSIEERLKLFRQICSAVEFAHSHSIIHRDIKPSNILVQADGVPKLLDFGIAKMSRQNAATASTATALRVMTPEYASPEQMRGERVTKATDIYSLGVLLYELVTGNRPYDFDSKSPYEIVRAVCEDEPIPPSSLKSSHGITASEKAKNQSSNRKLQKRDLDKIILKALRKEPERRYLSVQEFSEDIARLIEGLPVSAGQDTIFYHGTRFFRRHQTAVLSSLAVALVFLLVSFSMNLFSSRAVVSESNNLKSLENMYRDVPTESKKGGTDNIEARSLYVKAQWQWEKRRLESIKDAAELFRQAAEKDPEFALAYSGLSNSYFLLSVWGLKPAKEMFPQAKAASLRAIELAPEAAEGHLSLAMVYWLYEFDWQAADREFKTAIALNPDYARAPHWYGLFLAEMGRFDEAVTREKHALVLEPQSIPVKADLARVLFYARRYEESWAQYQEILNTNPNFGAVYVELIQLYEAAGMINEWAALTDLSGGFNDPNLREAYEKGGLTGYWRKKVELAEKAGKAGGYPMAVLYAKINNNDRAIELLYKALEERAHAMAQIKVHPELDNLRSDPRFAELLRRMNFEN